MKTVVNVMDTGMNYLLVQEVDGRPVRGLVVDKTGDLESDLSAFGGAEPRVGSEKLDRRGAERVMRKSRPLATYLDGKMVKHTQLAEDDQEFMEYASYEPEAQEGQNV